jgi:hypothetical protein
VGEVEQWGKKMANINFAGSKISEIRDFIFFNAEKV